MFLGITVAVAIAFVAAIGSAVLISTGRAASLVDRSPVGMLRIRD